MRHKIVVTNKPLMLFREQWVLLTDVQINKSWPLDKFSKNG